MSIAKALLLGFLGIVLVGRISADERAHELRVEDVVLRCLESNFDIGRSKLKVSSAFEKWRATRGDFDFILSTAGAKIHQEKDILQDASDVFSFDVGISKLMPNGLKLSTSWSGQRIAEPTAKSGDIINHSNVNLKIEVPISRLGRKSIAAASTVAEIGWEIEQHNLKFQVLSIVRDALLHYWHYRAEWMILEEMKNSESRALLLVNDSKELINNNELAKAELIQYQGNLENKISARLAQEQALHEVKLNLGKLMACSSEECSILLMPTESFPELEWPNSVSIHDVLVSLCDQALAQRYDFRALEKEKSALAVLYEASAIGSRPDFRVNFGIGYTGFFLGDHFSSFINSLAKNTSGANVNAGFIFAWEVENNRALGNLRQKLNDMAQADIDHKEMLLEIKSSISVFLNRITRLSEQRKYVERSVMNFKKAIANEKLKYKMGMSTQIDVIQTEEKLLESVIRDIQIKRDLAIAIVDLRFATGTLGDFEDEKFIFDMKDIAILPGNVYK